MAYSMTAYHCGPTHYSSSNPNPAPFPAKRREPSLTPTNSHRPLLHPPSPYQPSLTRHQQPFTRGRSHLTSSRNATINPMPLSCHVKTKPSNRRLVASNEDKNGSQSSSQTSIWSTPLAPRVKKPFVAAVLPQAPGGRSSTMDGVRRGDEGAVSHHYPSTHSLLKKHSYLKEGTFTNMTTKAAPVDRHKEEVEEGGGEGEGVRTREAWQHEEKACQVPRVVKPFRRTEGRKAPEGVPLLNLSRLNEPDDLMEAIELLESGGDHQGTQRSVLSWGIPMNSTEILLREEEEEEAMVVQDVTEDTGRQHYEDTGREEEVDERLVPRLDVSQFDFVEQKVLSHERGKAAPPSSTHSHYQEPAFYGPGVPTRPPPSGVFKSHVTLGMGVSEAALSKKLRFEARVLTQNGRDVHRELCGFFFVSDGSLTVYEFRQFGKKASALPLIHRGLYSHQSAHRGGQPYEIRDIRKGATLHFLTSAHPSLPETLASRRTLAVRVTQVDENAKRDVLCEGKNPMECRAVESYLLHSPSPHDKENCLLQTLQGMLRSRLRGRASRTLIGLGRHLEKVCHPSTGTVSCSQLQQALRTFHISLTQEDFSQLWKLLSTGYHTPAVVVESEDVNVETCIGALVGEMSEDRKALIRKVFQKLDGHKSGRILMSVMRKFFSASLHPDVLADRRSPEEVWFGMFGYLAAREHAAIDYADFEHYYEGLSIETKSDAEFFTLVRNCWAI